MATDRGWGGGSRTGSNHPALACANDAPPPVWNLRSARVCTCECGDATDHCRLNSTF